MRVCIDFVTMPYRKRYAFGTCDDATPATWDSDDIVRLQSPKAKHTLDSRFPPMEGRMIHNGFCKRCFVHGISYPWSVESCLIADCPDELYGCQGYADEDWQDKVADHNGALRPAVLEKMKFRFTKLHAAGFDPYTADFLAAGTAPLGQVLAARQAGLTDAQAISIWGD